MLKNKKQLLKALAAIGTASAVISPVAAVVSCGTMADKDKNKLADSQISAGASSAKLAADSPQVAKTFAQIKEEYAKTMEAAEQAAGHQEGTVPSDADPALVQKFAGTGTFSPFADGGQIYNQKLIQNIMDAQKKDKLIHLGFLSTPNHGYDSDSGTGSKPEVAQETAVNYDFVNGGAKDKTKNGGDFDIPVTFAGNQFMDALMTSGGAWSWDSALHKSVQGRINLLDNIRKSGGDFILSIGGWRHNTPAVAVAKASQFNSNKFGAKYLAAMYAYIIDKFNLNFLDFDIEGTDSLDTYSNPSSDDELGPGQQGDVASTYPTASVSTSARQLRLDALKILKNDPEYKTKLHISFTVPVFQYGFADKIQDMVIEALNNDLVDKINIMTMDFGNENQLVIPGQMAFSAISAANAVVEKIATDPNSKLKNKEIIYQKLGITPMIGDDDTAHEVFTITDAKILTNWAINHNIGYLNEWVLGRDFEAATKSAKAGAYSTERMTPDQFDGTLHAGGGSELSTGLNAKDGSFSDIFKHLSAGTPIPTEDIYVDDAFMAAIKSLGINNLNDLFNYEGSDFGKAKLKQFEGVISAAAAKEGKSVLQFLDNVYDNEFLNNDEYVQAGEAQGSAKVGPTAAMLATPLADRVKYNYTNMENTDPSTVIGGNQYKAGTVLWDDVKQHWLVTKSAVSTGGYGWDPAALPAQYGVLVVPSDKMAPQQQAAASLEELSSTTDAKTGDLFKYNGNAYKFIQPYAAATGWFAQGVVPDAPRWKAAEQELDGTISYANGAYRDSKFVKLPYTLAEMDEVVQLFKTMKIDPSSLSSSFLTDAKKDNVKLDLKDVFKTNPFGKFASDFASHPYWFSSSASVKMKDENSHQGDVTINVVIRGVKHTFKLKDVTFTGKTYKQVSDGIRQTLPGKDNFALKSNIMTLDMLQRINGNSFDITTPLKASQSVDYSWVQENGQYFAKVIVRDKTSNVMSIYKYGVSLIKSVFVLDSNLNNYDPTMDPIKARPVYKIDYSKLNGVSPSDLTIKDQSYYAPQSGSTMGTVVITIEYNGKDQIVRMEVPFDRPSTVTTRDKVASVDDKGDVTNNLQGALSSKAFLPFAVAKAKAVFDNQVSTQDMLAAAQTALQSARQAAEQAGATDTTEADSLLKQIATKVNPQDVLDKAVLVAQSAIDNQARTVNSLTAAKTTLKSAIASAKNVGADITAANAKLASLEGQIKAITDGQAALDAAVATANGVSPTASATELQNALDALKAAETAAKAIVGVDTSQVAAAKTILQGEETAVTAKENAAAAAAAIAKASQTLADAVKQAKFIATSGTKDQLLLAKSTLEAAINAAIQGVDKTAANGVVQSFAAKITAITDGQAALDAAVATANGVSPTASATELQNALDALKAAETAAKAIVGVDTSQVAAAKTILQGEETAASASEAAANAALAAATQTLADAVNQAKIVLDNHSSTKDQLSTAKSTLEVAINAAIQGVDKTAANGVAQSLATKIKAITDGQAALDAAVATANGVSPTGSAAELQSDLDALKVAETAAKAIDGVDTSQVAAVEATLQSEENAAAAALATATQTLTDAVKQAKIVLDNHSSTKDQLLTAKFTLESAIKAAIQGVDKTAANGVVQSFAAKIKAITDGQAALDAAVVTANGVSPTASATELQSALDALKVAETAAQAIDGVDTSQAATIEATLQGEENAATAAIAAATQTLADAVKQAKTVLDNHSSTKDQLLTAKSTLEAATNVAIQGVDKTAANGVVQSLATKIRVARDGQAALDAAVATANGVSPTGSAAELQNALDALKAAETAAEAIDGVNTSQAATVEATLQGEENAAAAALAKATQVLADAIKQAKTVLDNQSSTKDQLSTAKSTLETAINAAIQGVDKTVANGVVQSFAAKIKVITDGQAALDAAVTTANGVPSTASAAELQTALNALYTAETAAKTIVGVDTSQVATAKATLKNRETSTATLEAQRDLDAAMAAANKIVSTDSLDEIYKASGELKSAREKDGKVAGVVLAGVDAALKTLADDVVLAQRMSVLNDAVKVADTALHDSSKTIVSLKTAKYNLLVAIVQASIDHVNGLSLTAANAEVQALETEIQNLQVVDDTSVLALADAVTTAYNELTSSSRTVASLKAAKSVLANAIRTAKAAGVTDLMEANDKLNSFGNEIIVAALAAAVETAKSELTSSSKTIDSLEEAKSALNVVIMSSYSIGYAGLVEANTKLQEIKDDIDRLKAKAHAIIVATEHINNIVADPDQKILDLIKEKNAFTTQIGHATEQGVDDSSLGRANTALHALANKITAIENTVPNFDYRMLGFYIVLGKIK